MTFLALLTALALFPNATTVAAAGTCSGADPAIVSVTPTMVSSDNAVNHYRLAVTVTNMGSMKQASNVLQSVVMHQNTDKTDTKGVPPLRPGQSYTANFTFQRSSEADVNSTHFRFTMQFKQPSPPGSMDCNLSNDVFRLEV